MDEKRLDGLSLDNIRVRIETLKRLFPEVVREGRLDYDMLKYGVPLTVKLTTLEIQGKKFYVVGEDVDLFICLDGGLAVEVIEEAARYAPKTMIFADNAFVDDNQMINAGFVLEKAKIEFRWM